jgi:hypothetical protein
MLQSYLTQFITQVLQDQGRSQLTTKDLDPQLIFHPHSTSPPNPSHLLQTLSKALQPSPNEVKKASKTENLSKLSELLA